MLVENRDRLHIALLLRKDRNEVVDDGDQDIGARKEHEKCRDIEQCVNDGDADGVDRIRHESEVDKRIDRIENQHEHARLQNAVKHLKPCGSSCTAVRSDCTDEAGHCRTDIRAHERRQHTADRERSGHRHGLKNADGSGGALQNNGHDQSCQKSHRRLFSERCHDTGEFRIVCQPGERTRHGGHSDHQDGKTDKNGGCMPHVILFGYHQQCNRNQSKNRSEIFGFDE